VADVHQERNNAVDSDKLKGKKKEVEGEAQQKWGEAKDKARDTWDDAKDKGEDIADRDKQAERKSA